MGAVETLFASPGARLSEPEVAAKAGVARNPILAISANAPRWHWGRLGRSFIVPSDYSKKQRARSRIL
jgi:hypothetical protein